jgi:hypothetical protein
MGRSRAHLKEVSGAAGRRRRAALPAPFVVVGFIAGLLVRAAYAFPAHKYVPDADSLNMGLRALAVLNGDLVVFFSGAQIGALEAYLHAAAFSIFGVSREAISLAPLLVGCATLVVFYLFIREVFGSRVAELSLLFLALPSPAYLAWTYMPNSYPETVFLCAATLWLSARMGVRGFDRWSALGLGLSAGLGWWNSPLTLAATIPAVLWLLTVRPESRRVSFWRLPAAGFLVGALPWIAYNVRYRFPSIFQVVRPVGEGNAIGAAAGKLLGENVPQLAIGMDPFGGGAALNEVQRLVRIPAAIVFFAAAAMLVLRAVKGDRRIREGLLLLGLVAAVTAGLFVFSSSGTFPGPTVRYVLPLAFVFAAALGLATDFVGRRNRLAMLTVAMPVLAFNLSGYYWPWTEQRLEWRKNARSDQNLIAFLEKQKIGFVLGEYWTAYPVNFLSTLTVRGIPLQPQFDFYRIGDTLPARAPRFALISRNDGEIRLWASRIGIRGQISEVGPGYLLLPVSSTDSSTRTVHGLRNAISAEVH